MQDSTEKQLVNEHEVRNLKEQVNFIDRSRLKGEAEQPKEEKKKLDFQARAEMLKNELNNVAEVLTTRFDNRIANLESAQESRASGFTKLIETFQNSIREEQELVSTKTQNYVDKQTA